MNTRSPSFRRSVGAPLGFAFVLTARSASAQGAVHQHGAGEADAAHQRILDEDNFQIILDTFRDSRSGYMFVTSPMGAKLEQQVFEEGSGLARADLRGLPEIRNRQLVVKMTYLMSR